MAIDVVTFDAVGVAVAKNGTTVDLTTLTIGSGDNRALIVQLAWAGATPLPGLTINWDATGVPQPLTPIPGAGIISSLNGVQLYGLVNPTPGNKRLRLAWSGASRQVCVQAVSWINVDQFGGARSFPGGANLVHVGSSTTLSVTGASGDAAMMVGVTSGNVNSVNATQTFLDNSIISSAGNRVGVGSSTPVNMIMLSSGGTNALAATIIKLNGPVASGISTATGVGATLISGDASTVGVSQVFGRSDDLIPPDTIPPGIAFGKMVCDATSSASGAGRSLAQGVADAFAIGSVSGVSGISGAIGTAKTDCFSTATAVGISTSNGTMVVAGFGAAVAIPVINFPTADKPWAAIPACSGDIETVPFTADTIIKFADSTIETADQTEFLGMTHPFRWTDLDDCAPSLSGWIGIGSPPPPVWTKVGCGVVQPSTGG